MKLGLNDVTTIYLGSAEAEKIYLGSDLVYSGNTPPAPHDYSKDYLTMDILSGGTIVWTAPNSSTTRQIYYSIDDGQTWNSRTSSTGGTLVANVNAGDKVMLKGNRAFYGNNNYGNGFSASTASFNLQGNIMSLISGDSFSSVTTFTTGYVFKQMFKETKVVNAENLILPATSVTDTCYQSMFQNCTSLLTAPELPATAQNTAVSSGGGGRMCYNAMFRGCTNLVKAPSVLPSFNLGQYCFANMFRDCTSLATAPAYLGTSTDTVPTSGAVGMFYGCTSLTTAPELPAATVQQNSYTDMFNGCSSLSSITCLAISVHSAGTTNWTNGVAATGTFVKNDYMTGWTTGASGIPNGWTVQDYGGGHDYSTDYLTFVALENGTFQFTKEVDYSIDDGNTWVTLAANTATPTVNAGDKIQWKKGSVDTAQGHFTSTGRFAVEGNIMTLRDGVTGGTVVSANQFQKLFMYATGLTSAKNLVLPATTLASQCYGDMFNGCTSLTTVPALPATTLGYYCYGGMFEGCTSLTTAPVLSATTLAEGCYLYMFSRCTSLTTAPALPATTLAIQCYQGMFNGCTSLSNVTCLATDISANNCTTDWTNGVAATGTFTKAASMSSWTTGVNGIPDGWTVTDYSE